MKKVFISLFVASILLVVTFFSVYAKQYTIPVIIDGMSYTGTVSFNDKTGILESMILTRTEKSLVVEDAGIPGEATVTDNFTLAFRDPSTNSGLCNTFLEKGEIVTVIGKNRSSTWVKVDLTGEQCWIRSRQIDEIPNGVSVTQ